MLKNLVSRCVSTQDSLFSWYFSRSHASYRRFCECTYSKQSWGFGNFNIIPFNVAFTCSISSIRVVVFAKVVHMYNSSGDMSFLHLFIPHAESNQVCPGSSDWRVGFPWLGWKKGLRILRWLREQLQARNRNMRFPFHPEIPRWIVSGDVPAWFSVYPQSCFWGPRR